MIDGAKLSLHVEKILASMAYSTWMRRSSLKEEFYIQDFKARKLF